MKIFVVALLICPFLSYSQSADSVLADSVFTKVDQSASFPNGIEGWGNHLRKVLKYPKQAQRMGIQGRVFVEFIVEKDGTLSSIKVVKGIGAGCDEEAIRVLRDGPNWIPGKVNGMVVRQKMISNISFRYR